MLLCETLQLRRRTLRCEESETEECERANQARTILTIRGEAHEDLLAVQLLFGELHQSDKSRFRAVWHTTVWDVNEQSTVGKETCEPVNVIVAELEMKR